MNCTICGMLIAVGSGDTILDSLAAVSVTEQQEKFASHMLYCHPTKEQIISSALDLPMYLEHIRLSVQGYQDIEKAIEPINRLVETALRLKSYIDKGFLPVLD